MRCDLLRRPPAGSKIELKSRGPTHQPNSNHIGSIRVSEIGIKKISYRPQWSPEPMKLFEMSTFSDELRLHQ
jgi:hypothetical protein